MIGAAAIAVGIAMIAIAVAVLSDDEGSSSSGAPANGAPAGESEQPASGQGGGTSGGAASGGGDLSRQLSARRRVRAPAFALDVVDEGAAPAQGRAGALSEAVAGGSLALARLRGSPVVLHMWSSQCGPCRSDARPIQTTWQRWGPRGVAFVGVSVDEPAEAAQKFAREYHLTYPIVRDGGGRVADAYGVTSLPETFFISRSGDVVGHVAGSPSVRQMELGAAAARTGRTFGSEQGGSREPRS